MDDARFRFTPSSGRNPNVVAQFVQSPDCRRSENTARLVLPKTAGDKVRPSSMVNPLLGLQTGETPVSVGFRLAKRYEGRSFPPFSEFLCPLGSEREGQTDTGNVPVVAEVRAILGLKGVASAKIKHQTNVSNVQIFQILHWLLCKPGNRFGPATQVAAESIAHAFEAGTVKRALRRAQACMTTWSSPDSDKFRSSCTDGYRPSGRHRTGHPSRQTLHNMRGFRLPLPGSQDLPRHQSTTMPKRINPGNRQSRRAGSGVHEAAGKGCAPKRLPGIGNQPSRTVPVSEGSDDDPIRNGSPAARQSTLQLKSELAHCTDGICSPERITHIA